MMTLLNFLIHFVFPTVGYFGADDAAYVLFAVMNVVIAGIGMFYWLKNWRANHRRYNWLNLYKAAAEGLAALYYVWITINDLLELDDISQFEADHLFVRPLITLLLFGMTMTAITYNRRRKEDISQ